MISPFKEKYQEELKEFVLRIQNEELGLKLGLNEQLDLINTKEFYHGGGFWIAQIDNRIVGCIGLQRLNPKIGVLKKMFVSKDLRGKELNIAQKLFIQLKNEAQSHNLESILLDTPSVAKASHRFYEKKGFKLINKLIIPKEYTYTDYNSKIYELKLN
jgi:N-acetylglutamate synthase-like GNAT family acetyltransferase